MSAQDELTKTMGDLMIDHQKELNALVIETQKQALREATAKADAAEIVKQICMKQLGMDEAQAAMTARKWVT